jgi:hypothetical protein
MSKKPAGRPRELDEPVQMNLCVEAGTKIKLEELTDVAKQDDPKASLSRVASALIVEKHEKTFKKP